jgi:N-hydroxyarylamine O-acetyltransferase
MPASFWPPSVGLKEPGAVRRPKGILAVTSYVSRYLDRISYSGSREPTPATLHQLHRAHLFAVPFENLDITLGRKIVCDQDSFLRKIVEQRRGGFCYELNGAFAALLRKLGFKVTLLSARAPREDGGYSPEFDHLALKVDLEETWLADVGFGDSFLDPLRLQIGEEQKQGASKFRILEQSGLLYVERTEPNSIWKRQYCFTLVPRRLDEFAPMCHYHQTSPESPFTRKSLCTKATPYGRITLSDRNLIITRNGTKEERQLTEEEWRTSLPECFGVIL